MSVKNEAYNVIDTMSDDEIRDFMSGLETNEEKNAFKTQLMLRGRNVDIVEDESDPESEYFIPEEIDDDDFDIEIDDKKPTKKDKGKKQNTKTTKVTRSIIPMKEEFSSIPKDMTVGIILNAHSMHYNDQDWPVNRREVTYDFDLVTSPIQAKTVANIFSEGSDSEANKAANGDIRYFAIRSFVEAIPTEAKCLGYIKISSKDGKLYKKVIINKSICKNNNIDYDTTMSRVVDTLKNNGIN